MKIESGWLAEARKVPSEHFNLRPEDTSPWLLVVHNISLPPGNSAGRGLISCLRGALILRLILISVKLPP